MAATVGLCMGKGSRNKRPVERSFTATNAVVGHGTYLRMVNKAVKTVIGKHVVGRYQLVTPHLNRVASPFKHHGPQCALAPILPCGHIVGAEYGLYCLGGKVVRTDIIGKGQQVTALLFDHHSRRSGQRIAIDLSVTLNVRLANNHHQRKRIGIIGQATCTLGRR